MKKVVSWIATWSPVLHAVDLVFGALLCFVIAYNRGDVSAYLPYISETGAIVPEMCLYSGFLVFASIVGMIAMFYRYLLVSYVIGNNNMLRKINVIGFLIGLTSMASLAGIAVFPMSTVLLAHVAVASAHFIFAVLYSNVQTYISLKMKPPYLNITLNRMRLGLAIFLVLSSILMTIIMPLGHFEWIKYYPDRLEASKTPADKGFGLILTGSLLEWLWYAGWLTYFTSLTWENRKFEIFTLIRPKGGDVENKDPETHSANNNGFVY